MGLEEFVKLDKNESIIAQYNCSFPTKAKRVMEKIGEKKVLLIFNQKYKYNELVDEQVTLNGTLYLTNKKIYFVSSAGLIFKRRELVLSIDYKEITSAITQGLIFKDLVIGVPGNEKDGAIINHIFHNLPAEEVKNTIIELQGGKKEETESEELPTETTEKETTSEKKEIEKTEYCVNCGHKISPEDNFCAGCGRSAKQEQKNKRGKK